MVRDRFSRFEEHIAGLVEGSFARLFSGHLHPREIAIQLARAMEDGAQADESGQMVAPHAFSVALNPADFDALLKEQPDLSDSLAAEVVDMARAAGLHMPVTPSVQVVPDARVASHRAIVQASQDAPGDDTTQSLEAVRPDPAEAAASLGAVLVVGADKRVIPLERDVINVGRSRENHVILDDERVSRQHAQLRLRFGQYVLYDLDSQAGTMVNGQAVRERVLQHGDVISLGGARLVYSQDGAPQAGDAGAEGPGGLEDTDGHTPVEPTP